MAYLVSLLSFRSRNSRSPRLPLSSQVLADAAMRHTLSVLFQDAEVHLHVVSICEVCLLSFLSSSFFDTLNLGHLRSHTEERPYICDWPGCKKGFARQHDCKSVVFPFLLRVSLSVDFRRHQALHTSKPQSNVCQGCKKTFSRLDALNVSSRPCLLFQLDFHLVYRDIVNTVSVPFQPRQITNTFFFTVRSDGGAECRPHNPKFAATFAPSQSSPHLPQMPPLNPPPLKPEDLS